MNPNKGESENKPVIKPLLRKIGECVWTALKDLGEAVKSVDAGDVNEGELRAQLWGFTPPDTIPDDIMRLPYKKTTEDL